MLFCDRQAGPAEFCDIGPELRAEARLVFSNPPNFAERTTLGDESACLASQEFLVFGESKIHVLSDQGCLPSGGQESMPSSRGIARDLASFETSCQQPTAVTSSIVEF